MAAISTLVDLLRVRADQYPQAPRMLYLADGETEEIPLPYGLLDRQARAVAARLQAQHSPGERALLLFAPGPEIITGYFGALYAGLAAVPVDLPPPGQSTDELMSFAADAEPSVILTSAALRPKIQKLLGALPAPGGLSVVAVDAPEAAPEDWRPPALAPEALAMLLYTSGSTGRPRGIRMTHDNLLRRLGSLMGYVECLMAGRPMVSWTPLSHAMGLFSAVLQPMYSDLQAVMFSTTAFIEKPVRWLQAITRYEAASSPAPNFAFQACIDQVAPEEREGLDLQSWGAAVLGSETIRLNTLEQFAATYAPYGFDRRAFYTTYGMSEGGGASTLYTAEDEPAAAHQPLAESFDRFALREGRAVVVADDDEQAQSLVNCGSPMADHEILIVDPETRRALPDGTVGEVWMQGPSVNDGYWRNPEATEATFDGERADTGEGGYLRSGDLGFFHEGNLYVTGRIKDMLIVRGKNIYAVDVETVAEQAHPSLLSGGNAAFSVTEGGEERLVLALEAEPDSEVDVEAVAAAVRRSVGNALNLPVHQVVIVEAGSLPRTRTGKIQRHRCREQFLETTAAAS